MSDAQKLEAALKEINELKAALKLKQSELASNRLAAIVEFSDDAIISKDLNSIIITWNKGAERIFGYSAGEMIGTSIMCLIPADRQDEENHILGKIKNGESVEHFETLRQTKYGRQIHVSVTASPIKDATGKVIGVSKIARDITVQKAHQHEIARLTRLYAALSQVNQAIVMTQERDELFSKVCRVLVEFGGFRMAWIGWLDEETRKIIPVAQHGDGLDYLSQITFYVDGNPERQGPCGIAVHDGKTYICNDFARDPCTALRREEAQRAGFQSAAALPIRLHGKVCGVISVYANETKIFQDKEIHLLEEAAGDVSFALDNFEREKAQRASESRYRSLFEYAPDGIVIANLEGRYLDANASICHMLGYTRDELIGKNASDIVVPAEIPHIEPALDVIKAKSDYHREWQFRRKDGSVFAADVIATTMPDGNILAMFRDITERKKAEEARLAGETRFKELAENINEVFWMTDPTGHEMLYVSPVFEKIWGRTCESLYAAPQSWLDAIHPEDRNRVIQTWVAATQSDNREPVLVATTARKPDYEEEYRIVRPDKSVRWIHDRGFIIRNQAGQMQRIVGVARDITENRKLEAQLRQSQKMEAIGQLAGGVAHDFNNILAVISMQSELLKSSGGLSTEQSEFADEIGVTVQRAAALTRQLLLFSRREVFQPRDLDLSASITSTTKMLMRVLGENIRMELKLASQPMFIHADAGMIDQVLLNLAVNARDAMPNGGHLIIETSGVEFDEFAASQSPQMRPGSFVRLSVSDSGCGIPPEILPKIFEPFFTTKDVGKGTGLGLATVFGIVQQHQGWINVYSEVNHGTTFRVYLPRLAKNGGKKSSQPATTTMSGGNETILLVEDDLALRVSIRKTLWQLGYRILEAPTGVKALEVWKQNRDEIRLLLTDLVMPDGMSGKDLAQHILQENPKLKVIYMSGYSAEVVGKDFPLKEGVNFLTKPFQASKLAQAIRDSLDSH